MLTTYVLVQREVSMVHYGNSWDMKTSYLFLCKLLYHLSSQVIHDMISALVGTGRVLLTSMGQFSPFDVKSTHTHMQATYYHLTTFDMLQGIWTMGSNVSFTSYAIALFVVEVSSTAISDKRTRCIFICGL